MSEDGWGGEAPEFHIVVDATVDPPCVTVSGDIDLATCAPFRDALNEAVETGAREIVVDFKRVAFMGSIGIRELVRTMQQVDRIEVRAPAPIVRRALEAAGVGSKIVIADE